MAIMKTHRPELELVKQGAERLAHRTNSTFVLNEVTLDSAETEGPRDETGLVQDKSKTVNFR
ncbi:MAG: hypothetical protein NTZ72_19855 [Afipia sp.]|nr:hypothetical protein [Afipia sp.]